MRAFRGFQNGTEQAQLDVIELQNALLKLVHTFHEVFARRRTQVEVFVNLSHIQARALPIISPLASFRQNPPYEIIPKQCLPYTS